MSSEEHLWQVVCHMLVAALPSEAQDELLRTLTEMWVFYNETPEKPAEPRPPAKSYKVTAPVVRRNRPSFAIEDE